MEKTIVIPVEEFLEFLGVRHDPDNFIVPPLTNYEVVSVLCAAGQLAVTVTKASSATSPGRTRGNS